MRFSVWMYPYVGWADLEQMGQAARRAEQLGFESISISDHIICPTGPERDGVTPVWHDCFVLSTHLAQWTERARLVCCVVLPYRRLLPMAKQIASVDVVSGGRFTLVACTGWLRQEFDLLGVPYEQRGAITDEYLRAMKVLWTEDEPRFAGQYVRFSDIIFEPKCHQQPHVPIWIGGGGRRPIERVIALGDGWMPMGGNLSSELRDAVLRCKHEAAARGQDAEALDFRYTLAIGEPESALKSISRSIDVDEPAVTRGESAEAIAETVSRFAEAGFTELCLSFAWRSASDFIERIEWFTSEVRPLLGSAA
jgi:probable F420-dependent oxidoreductase